MTERFDMTPTGPLMDDDIDRTWTWITLTIVTFRRYDMRELTKVMQLEPDVVWMKGEHFERPNNPNPARRHQIRNASRWYFTTRRLNQDKVEPPLIEEHAAWFLELFEPRKHILKQCMADFDNVRIGIWLSTDQWRIAYTLKGETVFRLGELVDGYVNFDFSFQSDTSDPLAR